MMTKSSKLPIIGIPGRSFRIERDVVHEVFAIGQSYANAVVSLGGVVLPIPPVAENNFAAIDTLYDCCDGILFPGGEDIHPRLYGEEAKPALRATSEERDACDSYLMRRASEDKKPILGICRGLQMANVVFGGTLYQDLATEEPRLIDHPITGWQEIRHNLELVKGSRLSNILGGEDKIRANSLHHQGIKTLASNLRAVAFSEDGLIEGVEATDPNWFLVAVQCHPETLWNDVESKWAKLFSCFIMACADYKSLRV